MKLGLVFSLRETATAIMGNLVASHMITTRRGNRQHTHEDEEEEEDIDEEEEEEEDEEVDEEEEEEENTDGHGPNAEEDGVGDDQHGLAMDGGTITKVTVRMIMERHTRKINGYLW